MAKQMGYASSSIFSIKFTQITKEKCAVDCACGHVYLPAARYLKRSQKSQKKVSVGLHDVGHCNSSVIGATSIKFSITSRWALMAARGWDRLILDRRRGLMNDDRPSRGAAAEVAPPRRSPRQCHFDNPTGHSLGSSYHGEAAWLTCFALYLCL